MNKIIILIAFALLAAGCNKQTPNINPESTTTETAPENVTETQSEFPKDSPHPAPQKKVSTVNWKTYTNAAYGLSFQYPANWKLAEYRYDNVQGRGIIGVAIDPSKVSTQEEFDTLDKSSGVIQIFFGDGRVLGYDSFGDTTVGPSKIPAKYSKMVYDTNVPNPSMTNTTDESYYMDLQSKYQTEVAKNMEWRFNYPNSKSTDSTFQDTLQTIIATLIFIK